MTGLTTCYTLEVLIFSLKYCAIFSLTFWARDGISKLNLLPLCVLWSDLWSRPQSFPRCLLCRWQRGRRTSCWRWCPDTMSLGTWNQTSDRSHIRLLLRLQKVCLTYGPLLVSSLGIQLTGVHLCQSITMKQRQFLYTQMSANDTLSMITYSIGNQSPQSSLTFSMSSWQRKRSWTSLRAVGGTTSLIHTCRFQQSAQERWWDCKSRLKKIPFTIKYKVLTNTAACRPLLLCSSR